VWRHERHVPDYTWTDWDRVESCGVSSVNRLESALEILALIFLVLVALLLVIVAADRLLS
jgi:hypothetical protein